MSFVDKIFLVGLMLLGVSLLAAALDDPNYKPTTKKEIIREHALTFCTIVGAAVIGITIVLTGE